MRLIWWWWTSAGTFLILRILHLSIRSYTTSSRAPTANQSEFGSTKKLTILAEPPYPLAMESVRAASKVASFASSASISSSGGNSSHFWVLYLLPGRAPTTSNAVQAHNFVEGKSSSPSQIYKIDVWRQAWYSNLKSWRKSMEIFKLTSKGRFAVILILREPFVADGDYCLKMFVSSTSRRLAWCNGLIV